MSGSVARLGDLSHFERLLVSNVETKFDVNEILLNPSLYLKG